MIETFSLSDGALSCEAVQCWALGKMIIRLLKIQQFSKHVTCTAQCNGVAVRGVNKILQNFTIFSLLKIKTLVFKDLY